VFTIQVTAITEGSAKLIGPNVSNAYKGTPSEMPVTVILPLPYGAVVRFADGTAEEMPNLTGTNPAGSTVQYFFVSGVPWFSAHTSPQAAVSENMTSVTLYVSV